MQDNVRQMGSSLTCTLYPHRAICPSLLQRCTICKLVPPPHLVLFVFGFEEDRIRSGVVGQNSIKYGLYYAFVAYARCALL